MPSGRVHSSNTILTSALMLIGSIFADPMYLSNADVLSLVLGCLSGIVLSPDLDVNSGYIGLYYLKRIWIIGPLLSLLWWIFWLPYRWIIPHRSWLSHLPGVSTVLRELVLIVPIYFTLSILRIPLQPAWRFLGLFTIGLTISDTYHAYADWMSGEYKE